jgi:hypothetical protein
MPIPDVNLPLTRATLDLRSPDGAAFDGISRLTSNLIVTDEGGLRRLGGWPRLGIDDEHKINQDLHDQLLQAAYENDDAGQPVGAREAVTFLYELKGGISDAGGTSGSNRLLAGTRSRVYVNTGLDRNWRCVGFGFGGGEKIPKTTSAAVRWRCAQIGNIAILTNGGDRPQWFSYGEEPSPILDDDGNPTGDYTQAMEPVDDLIALGVTSAAVIGQYRGCMFLGSVVMEGFTYKHRVLWSDYNAPLDWTPLPNSLAGYVDLSADEEIMEMAELGGSFRIYTTKAIYDVNLVGGDEIFNFRRLWAGPEILRYRNSLINMGDQHLWAGEDRIYYLTESDRRPRFADGLYAASGAIYRGADPRNLQDLDATVLTPFGPLEPSACHNFIGGYDSVRKNAWYSWPTAGHATANMSLVWNRITNRATLCPRGFTAFVTHQKTYGASVRRWLADEGVCPAKPLWDEGNPLGKDDFVPIEVRLNLPPCPPSNTAPCPPLYIRNPAECSGKVAGYAEWLAQRDWCCGRPPDGSTCTTWLSQHPLPVSRSGEPRGVGECAGGATLVEGVTSNYVLTRGSDLSTPDEISAEAAAKAKSLLLQEWKFLNPGRTVGYAPDAYVFLAGGGSSATSQWSVLLSTGEVDKDLLDPMRYSYLVSMYWYLSADLCTPFIAPDPPPPPDFCDYTVTVEAPGTIPPVGTQFDITVTVGPGTGTLPAESTFTYQWELQGGLPGAAEITYNNRSRITVLLHDAATTYTVRCMAFIPGCVSGKGMTLSLTPGATPVGNRCGYDTHIEMAAEVIAPGVPVQAECIIDWDDPTQVFHQEEWTFTWSLSPSAVCTSEILSTSANHCSFVLGDTDIHTLKCVATRTGCSASEAVMKVQSGALPVEPRPVLPCLCTVDPRAVCNLLTHPDCTPCGEGWVFISASVDDFTLKEFSEKWLQWDYYTPPAPPLPAWVPDSHPTVPMADAAYRVDGYTSLLQVDSNTFGAQAEKRVLRMTTDFDADDVPDVTSAYLHVWAGTGAQAGQLFWQKSKPRRIDRLSLRESQFHREENTRPARQATYQFYRSGTHVAFRLIIGNEEGKPITGGAVSLNWAKGQVLGSRKDYE